jgi:hypothetical protein
MVILVPLIWFYYSSLPANDIKFSMYKDLQIEWY